MQTALIWRYTRKQAVADGVLIDITEKYGDICQKFYSDIPITCSAEVYNNLLQTVDAVGDTTIEEQIHQLLWFSNNPDSSEFSNNGEFEIARFLARNLVGQPELLATAYYNTDEDRDEIMITMPAEVLGDADDDGSYLMPKAEN
ncbi:DUF6573 family protein [Oryzomonas rubra]|uniref:Uncharacterized protein n=1 Tax=Oryzomonas rubra TaxID=2509454 RepID=A0A5A9X4S3_9BACT|nr:DUF6573 family protein [Oryzomonas rubra]KAA0888067.1 hypothetical protein ET418_16845 [Oryzomonas rubra]